MQGKEFINLLNCTANFIGYGKHNIIEIFDWEQKHLLEQTGQQATILNSYKYWTETANKIIIGTGVNLSIDGEVENHRFFDISQTSNPKYKGKTKPNNITENELLDNKFSDKVEFLQKERQYLLTSLWTELDILQGEYEKEVQTVEKTIKHMSIIYVTHKRFKSNWHNEDELVRAYDRFYTEWERSYRSNISKDKSNIASDHEDIINHDILGQFNNHILNNLFPNIYQTTINLTVNIKNRYKLLLDKGEEDYYQKMRFYTLCKKEKIAICRLRGDSAIDINLSISNYEIVETLPYKPNMDRYDFLEYLQLIYNNKLNQDYLILVRKYDIKDKCDIVATYRIEVNNWGVRPSYNNLQYSENFYPISFYIRFITIENLENAEKPQKQQGERAEEKLKDATLAQNNNVNKDNTAIASTTSNRIKPSTSTTSTSTTSKTIEKPNTGNSNKKTNKKSKLKKKKYVDVLLKINKFTEDLSNKTC